MTEDQIQDPTPAPDEVIGLAILGQGGDTPELHVRYTGSIKVLALTNPVTVKQITDTLAPLA